MSVDIIASYNSNDPTFGDSAIKLKEDILDCGFIIMKPQKITNIFYALLGMGILIYAIESFS